MKTMNDRIKEAVVKMTPTRIVYDYIAIIADTNPDHKPIVLNRLTGYDKEEVQDNINDAIALLGEDYKILTIIRKPSDAELGQAIRVEKELQVRHPYR